MSNTQSTDLQDVAFRDVIGEATEEEAAMLRTDENVRKWYAALKQLKAQGLPGLLRRSRHHHDRRGQQRVCGKR